MDWYRCVCVRSGGLTKTDAPLLHSSRPLHRLRSCIASQSSPTLLKPAALALQSAGQKRDPKHRKQATKERRRTEGKKKWIRRRRVTTNVAYPSASAHQLVLCHLNVTCLNGDCGQIGLTGVHKAKETMKCWYSWKTICVVGAEQ